VRTAAAILRTRSGSAIVSIPVIVPSATVKLITANGRPRTVMTTPGAWLVSTNYLFNMNNLGLGIGSDGLCEINRGPQPASSSSS